MKSSLRIISASRSTQTPAPVHIEAVSVSKRYRVGSEDVWALDGVSLSLGRGEFISLCGSSGSGKSTLLNLVACLDLPTEGEIFIGGRSTRSMSDDELSSFRASRLGFIFQTFNLMPVLSALENVEYPLLRSSFSASERKELAASALESVGLYHLRAHRPDQLSGGQRQRVAIARSIVHGPELIVADEPTANLDAATAGEILDLIGRLNFKLGVTVIVATHDPNVMKRTGRSVSLADGHLVNVNLGGGKHGGSGTDAY